MGQGDLLGPGSESQITRLAHSTGGRGMRGLALGMEKREVPVITHNYVRLTTTLLDNRDP